MSNIVYSYALKRRNGLVVLYAASPKEALLNAKRQNISLQNLDLTNADLSNLSLIGLDFAGSDFRGANLQDTYFILSNMRGCDFTGANLHGVDFSNADLSNIITAPQWIIQGQVRSDGVAFFLQRLTGDDHPMIRAGSIYLSVHAARAWYSAVEGTWDGVLVGTRGNIDETNIIIQAMVDTMKLFKLE